MSRSAIHKVSLSDYAPQRKNANKHTQRGMGMLESEMRKVGYVAPMTAAADGEIFDGSARLETSADVYGLEVEPIIVHSDGTRPIIHVRDDIPTASDPRAISASLAANRIAEINLEWDADTLQALQQQGADLSAYFREDELVELLQVGNEPVNDHSTGQSGESEDSELGYAISRDGVSGRALMDSRKNGGMELVKRLKDLETEGDEESAFWAVQMSGMARSAGRSFDVVTYPPGSGKRSHSLAEKLAGVIAGEIGIPCRALFSNPAPRQHRAVVASKLSEGGEYIYAGSGKGEQVLLVDDAYCTGKTLNRCVAAMQKDEAYLCVICRS